MQTFSGGCAVAVHSLPPPSRPFELPFHMNMDALKSLTVCFLTGLTGHLRNHLSSHIKMVTMCIKETSLCVTAAGGLASLLEHLSIWLALYKRSLPNVNTRGKGSLEALSDDHQYRATDESLEQEKSADLFIGCLPPRVLERMTRPSSVWHFVVSVVSYHVCFREQVNSCGHPACANLLYYCLVIWQDYWCLLNKRKSLALLLLLQIFLPSSFTS